MIPRRECGTAKLLVRACLFLSVIFLGRTLRAESSLIQRAEEAVVRQLCSDPTWLECWEESPERCDTIMRLPVRACLSQNLPEAYQEIRSEQARAVSLKVVRCIRYEFSSTRLFGRADAVECKGSRNK